MTIRLATADDIDALKRMAMHFIAYGEHGKMIDISEEQLEIQISSLLEVPTIAIFVAEIDTRVVGMIVGALSSPWFAPHVPMSTELAWWVEPEARGTTVALRLIRMYEGWAHANGAQISTMSALEMDNGTRVGNMLKRIGYAKAETSFIKEIR
jgi:GNAT superfamily N-acetyltransferase